MITVTILVLSLSCQLTDNLVLVPVFDKGYAWTTTACGVSFNFSKAIYKENEISITLGEIILQDGFE